MRHLSAIILTIVIGAISARADVKTTVAHNEDADATPAFKFKNVPSPSRTDAATKAKFSIVEGVRDANGGDVDKLNDGRLPDQPDQPEENFFFDAGTEGGRLAIDLGKTIAIAQVNTYSWHPNTRGPQVYKLYAGDGTAKDFNAAPKKNTDPEKAGWKLMASVDTRFKTGEAGGGQYGVSISDSTGEIGKFRYLLFDVSRTEDADDFGNTFFSEIDVIEKGAAGAATQAATQPILLEGKYATIDVSLAPDLQDWAQTKLLPICDEWYPTIVKMLPSDGFAAPEHFTVQFRGDMGRGTPAATRGTRISCNIGWFRRNLSGEAAGAVVHEMVHVVQQYGAARRTNPNAAPNPGWMVEGIADYIRW